MTFRKKLILAAVLLTSALAIARTTNNVYVMPNSGNIPNWGQVRLSSSSAVTGTLAIVNGGTGGVNAATAFDNLSPLTTRGDLIFRNATTNTRLAAGTANYFLMSNGAGTDPTYSQVINANVASGAAIARSKLATGTAHGLVVNDTSGDLSSVAPSTAGNVAVSNGTDFVSSAITFAKESRNLGFSAAISSNTLVVTLTQSDGSSAPTASAPVFMGFRSTSATGGGYSSKTFTATNAITLGTTDSIGSTASVAENLFVYIAADTTSEICLSHSWLNEDILTSASALTGGADTTNVSTLWCTSAHTLVPIRRIGMLTAIWSNPNWGTLSAVVLGEKYGTAMARYSDTSAQSVSAAVTVINIATKDYDTNGMWVTNTFTAPWAGRWEFCGAARATTAASLSIWALYLKKNASSNFVRLSGVVVPGSANKADMAGCGTLALAATDTIQVEVDNDSGGSPTLVNSTGVNNIWVSYIGP